MKKKLVCVALLMLPTIVLAIEGPEGPTVLFGQQSTRQR
jgi:hypothetical protein